MVVESFSSFLSDKTYLSPRVKKHISAFKETASAADVSRYNGKNCFSGAGSSGDANSHRIALV